MNNITADAMEFGPVSSPAPDTNKVSVFAKLQSIASLSQVIRMFGAFAILASMSLFMLQGWSEGNDITRYLKLLAQTGLLTGVGLLLSFVIKEVKGARVFFGLALASVVANFTILGSLTYSMFALDSLVMDYPSSMLWEVINPGLFMPVFIGAIMLLSAVSYFGFSIFSRHIAKPLTIGFLALSALLLVPVRESVAVAVLAAIALYGAWALIQRLSKHEKLVLTNEAKAAFGLLLVPGFIIVARAVSLYEITSITLLAFSALGFLILKMLASLVSTPSNGLRFIEISQFVLGIVMSFLAVDILPSTFSNMTPAILLALIIGFGFEQLINSDDKVWKKLMSTAITMTATPVILLCALVDASLGHSFQAILITGFVVALNLTLSRQDDTNKLSHIVSLVGIIAAILMVLFDLVQLAQLGNWMIIGLIGVFLIVGASIYERYGLKFLPEK